MKNWVKLGVTLAVTAVFSTAITCLALAAEEKATISVNGRGVISIEPDQAKLSFRIETQDKDAKIAQKKNGEIEEKAVSALKALGIKEEDIKTQYSSVHPRYKYEEETGERSIVGYMADYSFLVTTNDVDNTAKYIDAAIKAGVTSSDGVSFYVSNPNQQYAKALNLAIENAGNSANAIAAAFGSPLGSVVSVTEGANNVSLLRGTSDAVSAKYEAATTDAGGGSMDIRYDKIDVEAFVTVVYELGK